MKRYKIKYITSEQELKIVEVDKVDIVAAIVHVEKELHAFDILSVVINPLPAFLRSQAF